MRLLLINNNPAVSRLLRLSVDKAGYEMDEFEDYGLVPLTRYDVVMVDNELYDEEELTVLKEQVHCDYFLYICQRGTPKPDFVNVSLEKPFLPTDFLSLLEKIKNVINSFKKEEEIEDLEEDNEEEELEEIVDLDDDIIPQSEKYDFEEHPVDFDMEETEENDILAKNVDVEDMDHTLATFDLDEQDKELELPSFNSHLDNDEPSEEVESFDFEEKSAEDDIDEMSILEETPPSVLDKDDIDEVKQLLKESEEDEDNMSSFSPLKHEESEESFAFDEIDSDENTLSLDELTLNLPEEEVKEEEDVLEEEAEEEVETSLETQEDLIDDFAEEIEEKIEEESKETLFADGNVALEAEENYSIDSLDDLNENLLKKAFGEEVEEEILEPVQSKEIEVIRGEIENSIARSISGFAQSDILREALKGMKINISITFDEKN